jgi:hypothetical protein
MAFPSVVVASVLYAAVVLIVCFNKRIGGLQIFSEVQIVSPHVKMDRLFLPFQKTHLEGKIHKGRVHILVQFRRQHKGTYWFSELF